MRAPAARIAQVRSARVVAGLLLSASAAGCVTGGSGGVDWQRTVLQDVGAKVGCVAIGELDDRVPGGEVVATDESGGVHLLRVAPGAEGGYEVASTRIAELGGEGIQCVVGDADLEAPGLEIVTVGMQEGPEQPAGPGRAHLLRRDEVGNWRKQVIFDDAGGLLHAVAVVRGEVFVGGFSRKLYRVVHTTDGWRANEVCRLPGAAKNALPARDGIVVACDDGSLVHVTRSGAGWTSVVIDRRDAGRARLDARDGALLVADDDGSLYLLPEGGEPERVHKEVEKLRGAVLVDFDPAAPGPEAVTGGYGRRLWSVHRLPQGWRARLISAEGDRIHHVAGGEIDGRPGVEIVSAGFAGEVVMFQPR